MSAPRIKALALAGALLATAAQAQTVTPVQASPQPFQTGAILAAASLDPFSAARARPVADISAARIAFPHPSTVAETGFPQNSIDRPFAARSLAQIGYLCGLQPGPDDNRGVASSYEPIGTFLGAKLTMAF